MKAGAQLCDFLRYPETPLLARGGVVSLYVCTHTHAQGFAAESAAVDAMRVPCQIIIGLRFNLPLTW